MTVPPGNQDDNSFTLLDRRVIIVLDKPDETPSRKAGVSVRKEGLHRLHGTSLVFDVSRLLLLGASTCATACSIFHRFYQQASLTEYSVWSVAQASLLLATKVEEEPQTLKSIIQAFYHVYRKRVMAIDCPSGSESGATAWDWNHPLCCCAQEARTLSKEEKELQLESIPLPTKLGPVYKEWHDEASKMEAVILRQLGFTLYWIPDSHPHKFILYFCQALGLIEPKFTQRAWNYCNDSCRLDLCIRFPAEVIATSSILLAARDYALELPMSPSPWWGIFVGASGSISIAEAANAILGLSADRIDTDPEVLFASHGFVRSLVGNSSSFNDPGSFPWDHFQEVMSKCNS